MEFIFLNPAGETLFVRDDIENGHWVQQEMNITADFPYDENKVIESGQMIAFRDPATDVIEVFEIINSVNHEPEHYQQITAEHICISELSNEHIDNTEIEEMTPSEALGTALDGTLWEVGYDTSSHEVRSAKFSRGSVWNAMNPIQQTWDVYITPRVVISAAGIITHRYLDIAPATGVWRGLRLSLRKNLLDPSVTYDESELYTAVYGYGGSVDEPQQGGDDETKELTFADVVWTATDEHPAKPEGQTYLEWPEKTALYGRNGRPRFGYYQNGDIDNAEQLLEATWTSLQRCCEPKITISGTYMDLRRLGYADTPIRLRDMAIVEIEETGELFYKQIISHDVDLINPTENSVEIGDYIPSIVYINKETNEEASGGGNGGKTPQSLPNIEKERQDAMHQLNENSNMVRTVVGKKDGVNYVKPQAINNAVYKNDKDHDGVVLAGSGNASKVWKTDAQGYPAWRDESASGIGTIVDGLLSGTVTKAGLSYNNAIDLTPGKWIIFIGFISEANAILCWGNSYSNCVTDLASGGNSALVDLSINRTYQFYVNTNDTTNKTFYRMRINAIRIGDH